MENITQWIVEYGYGGLFFLLVLGVFGVPVPDEILLVFSGYLVFKGDFSLPMTMGVAFLGTICGISVSFTLGRTLGLFLVNKYGRYAHVTQERLESTNRWFNRVGRWGLIIGYFVPGLRHLVAYLAGISKYPYRDFALFAYIGGLVWSIIFVLVGYYLGEKWEVASQMMHRHLTLLSIVVLGAAGVYYFVKKKFRRKKVSETSSS